MKKNILLILIWILNNSAFSQTYQNQFEYQVYYETLSTDSLIFDSLCTRVLKLSVEDTTSISHINVKIGTHDGISDILEYSFSFDNQSNLPIGLSYRRVEKTIYLGLYNTYRADNYFYEINLVDQNNNFTETKKWN